MANSYGRKVKVGAVGCGVVATAYYLPYLAKGDLSRAKWPQPTPGAFNYYHASA